MFFPLIAFDLHLDSRKSSKLKMSTIELLLHCCINLPEILESLAELLKMM